MDPVDLALRGIVSRDHSFRDGVTEGVTARVPEGNLRQRTGGGEPGQGTRG